MAFSREVNDGPRLFALQQSAHEIAIDNIAMLKTIARIVFHRAQVVQIPRIGQLVKIQDAPRFRGDPLQNKIRPDKPRAAGHQNEIFHAVLHNAVLHNPVLHNNEERHPSTPRPDLNHKLRPARSRTYFGAAWHQADTGSPAVTASVSNTTARP